MADVFISYARVERDAAVRVKSLLEALGLTVFLDVDGLDGGDIFSEKLDREVKTSGVVLGLWSPTALSRPWVQIECDIGKRRGVLVPIAIKPFQDMEVPAPFWNIQYIDFTDGLDDDHPNWLKLRRSLARTLNRPDIAPPRASAQSPVVPSAPEPVAAPAPTPTPAAAPPLAATPRQKSPKVSRWPLIAAAAAALVVAAGGGAWWMLAQNGSTATPLAPEASLASNEPATPVTTPVTTPAAAPVETATDVASVAPSLPAAPLPETAPAAPVLPKVKLTLEHKLSGHTCWAYTGVFSADGYRYLTASCDKTARVWDTKSGQLIATLSGHTERMNMAAFTRDGRTVITAGWDGARLWDAATGQERYKFPNPDCCTAEISPDGARAIINTAQDGITIWDVAARTTIAVLKDETYGKGVFDPDGLMIAAAGSSDGKGAVINLWNSMTGKKLDTLAGDAGMVRGLTFSPDGRRLVSIGDKTARLWDVPGRRLLFTFPYKIETKNAAFSRDGSRVVVGASYYSDYEAAVWDTRTGKRISKLKNTPDYPVLSPDGTLVAAYQGGGSGKLGLWDANTGELIASSSGEEAVVNWPTFSPDGTRVAAPDLGGEAWIWRIDR